MRYALGLCWAVAALAQGTLGDYERAYGLRKQAEELAVNLPDQASWIEGTSRFWYRKAVKGGHEFVLVDAATLAKRPAFDLLVVPGQGHSPGGAYGERKRYDFFVHNLLGAEPPDWNVSDEPLPPEPPERP